MWYPVRTAILMAIVVALMIVTMSSLSVPEFEQGVIVGLVPGLAFWVIDRIEKGSDEKTGGDVIALTRQRSSTLFIALIVTSVTYWVLTLAWYSGFQNLLGQLIETGQLKSITPYADHAFQKTVGGGLFLSSWLPLTIVTCVIFGILLDRLQFPMVMLANAIALGAFVLITQAVGWTRSDLPIEQIFETMFRGSVDNAPLVHWDRVVLVAMALGALLIILLFLSVVMSLSLSIGAWLGRYGAKLPSNESREAIATEQLAKSHQHPAYLDANLKVSPQPVDDMQKETPDITIDTRPTAGTTT